MNDELNALRALKPKRPPSKQRKVDLWLDEIEKKRLEDGATIDEIRQVLFPELALSTFSTMLTRARRKREKMAGPASPSASAGKPRKRGGSADASPETARAKPSRNGEATASVSSGEGVRGAESALPTDPLLRQKITDSSGQTIEPQDSRIPPPWSDEPFDFSKLPMDIIGRDDMKRCRSWLEVHFFIKTIRKNGKMGSPGGDMLARKFEKQFVNNLEFE